MRGVRISFTGPSIKRIPVENCATSAKQRLPAVPASNGSFHSDFSAIESSSRRFTDFIDLFNGVSLAETMGEQ